MDVRDVKVVLNKIDFTERGQVANIINSRCQWRSRLVFGIVLLFFIETGETAIEKYGCQAYLLSKSWIVG